MTDLQCKGTLIDQLKDGQDLLELVPDISENAKARKKIEMEIKIIEEKMRF